ncbi:MAG TPA: PDZ domain-containing protein [Parafilimonas sp.]|nr:PDZ domain-containing protein [Parafilimonas sp.]
MLRSLKAIMLFLAVSIGFVKTNAQSAKIKKSGDEHIIIHKKDSTKEKITVVIDGDKITINGKPVDEFKSDDVDIIKQDWDYAYGGDMAVVAPMPPTAPQVEAFRSDMSRKIRSNTAFLGVMTEKTEKGAKITEVTDGSAAEKAGLKEGDVITKIGDDVVAGPDDLYKVVGKHKPDEKVLITYSRDGKQLTANATLGKSEQVRVYSWNSPGGEGFRRTYPPSNFYFSWNDKPRLGISAQDTEDGKGVKILEVDDDDDSPAAKAGLKEDDIITQVNGKAIASTDDLKESLKDIKKGDTVKITYKRNNQTQTIDVKFPKELKTIDL